ncbi:hypothetical protein MHYP_G00085410 [Metynnis hypsauchen]
MGILTVLKDDDAPTSLPTVIYIAIVLEEAIVFTAIVGNLLASEIPKESNVCLRNSREKMKRNQKQRNMAKSVASQEMEMEMQPRSPPSPRASNCFPRISLFKKDRIQERQREEKQKVSEENDDTILEETVKQQELQIIRFREREERMKRKLEKIREKIARKEQKTLEILQREEHLKRELHAMKERLAQKEKQREEDKNVTSKKAVDIICTVNVREEMKMDREREQQQEAEEQKERERQRARAKYMERKEQRRAEREKKLIPQEEMTFGPEKEAQRPVSIESKAEDLTSKTLSQVQTDGHTSGQRAEEKPERSGHDVGEAVVIEVETQQVESATEVSSGRRMLQSVLPTVLSMIGRLRSHSSARHVKAEVENKREDVSPPRPLVPGRTVETLVKESLFPCCRPTEETGTECRISAAVKDCIQKRGRLLRLRRGLAESIPAERTTPLRTSLKRRNPRELRRTPDNRATEKRKNGCMQVKEVESTCSK